MCFLPLCWRSMSFLKSSRQQAVFIVLLSGSRCFWYPLQELSLRYVRTYPIRPPSSGDATLSPSPFQGSGKDWIVPHPRWPKLLTGFLMMKVLRIAREIHHTHFQLVKFTGDPFTQFPFFQYMSYNSITRYVWKACFGRHSPETLRSALVQEASESPFLKRLHNSHTVLSLKIPCLKSCQSTMSFRSAVTFRKQQVGQ